MYFTYIRIHVYGLLVISLCFTIKILLGVTLKNSRSHFLDNYQKKEISFQAINKYREVVVLV